MKSIFEILIQKIENFNPEYYGLSRNYIDGDVSKLSPYISRGLISTKIIFDKILEKNIDIKKTQKFLQELVWREYWQKIWIYKDNIDIDLINKQFPVKFFKLPISIVKHNTGISAIDKSIEELYSVGYMHNHLRMYTASICCNIGQYHWLRPAKWMYYHLLDGDWGSNALSWQWVAGTNSNKKYIANQANINKFCYSNDQNTFLDKSYELLSKFEIIPNVLKLEIEEDLNCNLPNNEFVKSENNLPYCIYNSYNLDSNWRKEENVNRVLLFEPSHFKNYPVSKKVIDFIILISKEIKGIKIAVMEFKELKNLININSKIYFKEHPFCEHYSGNKDERDWIFPEIEVKGSFFNYWNKGFKKIIKR